MSIVRPAVTTSVLLLALFCLSIFIPTAHAVDDSPWIVGDPTLSAGKTVSNADYNATWQQREGHESPHAECINKKIETQLLGSLLNRYRDGCWYSTTIGLLHADGRYLVGNDLPRAGKIVTHSHSALQSRLRATANPDVFLEVVPNSGSSYWQFRSARNNDLVMDHDITTLGAITMNYRNSPSLVLKLESGLPMIASQLSLWWSGDNRHLLVWHEKQGALYRIDTETFEVLMVPVQDNPSNATLRGSAAMSPSGRYAAVTIENSTYADLHMVDFESCSKEAGEHITKGVGCEVTSLKHVLQANNISPYPEPKLPHFYGDHTLGIYHESAESSGSYTQYLLQADGTERQENKYVALGDSYSSGEGAGDYESGTDIRGINMCHTSRKSYPYLINDQLNLDSFFSAACSGARIEHFTSKEGQYHESRELYGAEHPGATPQSHVVDGNNIITLTMSGNDIHFADRLTYCLLGSSQCYSSYEGRMEIVNEVNDQYDRLVKMYEQILDDMGPNPRLYVLGYPQIVSNADDVQCGVNVQLNTYQRQMANDLITYLNAVIKSAAAKAGAYYVGTEGSFGGHKLCEAALHETTAVNGLTIGDDNLIVSNASFHPNEFGHRTLADTVLERTESFTEPMPDPDPTATIPDAENYPFLDVPSEGGLIRKLYHNPKAEPTLIERGKDFVIRVSNPFIPLVANKAYDVIFHSEPTPAGQVTTNGVGFIDEAITVPASLSPGMHEVHIQGVDEYNNPIDVYEFVYVAVSETDFDGDGVLNENEPCGVLEPSGQDQDEDGTDDACDPIIDIPAEDPDDNEDQNPDTPAPEDPDEDNENAPNPISEIVSKLIKLIAILMQWLFRFWF